ncbi:hypothetical protein E4T50_00053 [Aureobasidium sp. EXF-12298]|nr:hypothetical protein E4T50_00053 [Aureobasidium sp. EXF-12298]KAI4759964.1 hypothetical protein E4T51_07012 [Aureobasidium sp. EXF-12344]KAI4783063.1 hypothetical protein E4T52_02034 [Aureobasidium sp. EXF-3400]
MASLNRQIVACLFLVLRFVFLTFGPWLAHVVIADLLLSCLLPFAFIFPTYTYHLASTIAESVWRGVQRICEDSNGADIILAGDDLPVGETAIVVANHIEWTDFYLIQALAIRTGMLGRCRWFAKDALKWVPVLGWGLLVMGMPLVSRKWVEDKEEMKRLFSGILKGRWPIWLVSFSEGTRYRPKKHAEATRWCEANGKPAPQHTLHPRTKGFVATVQQLRKTPHVKAVYDVTIAYAEDDKFMSPPSFFKTVFQPNLAQSYRMYAYVRRFELTSLPTTDGEIAQWLEDKWVEKGERLAKLKKSLDYGEPWKGTLNKI